MPEDTNNSCLSAQQKAAALEAIYRFYDEFLTGFPIACSAGCSVCCTNSVSATSMEAAYLLQGLSMLPAGGEELLKRAEGMRGEPHFQPSTTINTSAALCMKGKELPEETSPMSFDPCPFLDEEGLCALYGQRPFACRAMSSSTVCKEGGEASMEPFLVTVNLAIYQILEHIDRDGFYGNILDLLPVAAGRIPPSEAQEAVKTNRALNCFIVPPDETMRFKSFMRRLSKVETEGGATIGELLPDDWVILS